MALGYSGRLVLALCSISFFSWLTDEPGPVLIEIADTRQQVETCKAFFYWPTQEALPTDRRVMGTDSASVVSSL